MRVPFFIRIDTNTILLVSCKCWRGAGQFKTAVDLVMAPTYHEGFTKLWELGRLGRDD